MPLLPPWMLLAVASLMLPREGVAASPSPPPPLAVSDETTVVVVSPSPWLWGSAAAFFVMLYVLLAFASWPMVRYRTGLPLLFLVLIIVFPPSFMVLLFYVVLLRIGLLSAVWIAAASAPTLPAGTSLAPTSTSTPSRGPRAPSSAPPSRAEVARRV